MVSELKVLVAWKFEESMSDGWYCTKFEKPKEEAHKEQKKVTKLEVADKASEDAEVKILKKEEEKKSLSYVIEGAKCSTVDHDVQERHKEGQSETKRQEVKVDKPVEYQPKRKEYVINEEIHDEATVEKVRSSATERNETELVNRKFDYTSQKIEKHKTVFTEDTKQREKILTEKEQGLVEDMVDMDLKKVQEKLKADVGKAHKTAKQEYNNGSKNRAKPMNTKLSEEHKQIEKGKVELHLTSERKRDSSKRESPEFDFTKYSPHKTIQREEVQRLIEIKQSEGDKEKRNQELEIVDKRRSTTKQKLKHENRRDQREKEVTKLPVLNEKESIKLDEENKDLAQVAAESHLQRKEVDQTKKLKGRQKRVDEKLIQENVAFPKGIWKPLKNKSLREKAYLPSSYAGVVKGTSPRERRIIREEQGRMVEIDKKKRQVGNSSKHLTRKEIERAKVQSLLKIKSGKRRKQRKVKKVHGWIESKSIKLDAEDVERGHVVAEKYLRERELSQEKKRVEEKGREKHKEGCQFMMNKRVREKKTLLVCNDLNFVGEEIDGRNIAPGYMQRKKPHVPVKIGEKEEKSELKIEYEKKTVMQELRASTEFGMMRELRMLPARVTSVVKIICSWSKGFFGEVQSGKGIESLVWKLVINQKMREGVLESHL